MTFVFLVGTIESAQQAYSELPTHATPCQRQNNEGAWQTSTWVHHQTDALSARLFLLRGKRKLTLVWRCRVRRAQKQDRGAGLVCRCRVKSRRLCMSPLPPTLLPGEHGAQGIKKEQPRPPALVSRSNEGQRKRFATRETPTMRNASTLARVSFTCQSLPPPAIVYLSRSFFSKLSCPIGCVYMYTVRVFEGAEEGGDGVWHGNSRRATQQYSASHDTIKSRTRDQYASSRPPKLLVETRERQEYMQRMIQDDESSPPVFAL